MNNNNAVNNKKSNIIRKETSLKQILIALEELTQSFYEMGGCLGPKQRRQEVYIEVIELIHEEARHIQFQQTQKVDVYESIKQRLSKKGLLRKLIDNLVSHRNKIYDSLNHNYQIVMQSSQLQNKYAGLLIIDQIIQGIYQSLKLNNMQGNGQNDNYSNISNKQSQKQNIQETLQQAFSKEPRQSRKVMMAMQGNPLIREVDSRFDLIYFRLVVYLLENVPTMYLRVLKSINSYSMNKKSLFLCTETVWEVMDFLMTKILSKNFIKESVFTYMLLLQNTKQNFKQYQHISDLKQFITLWISQHHHSPTTSTTQPHLTQQQSQTTSSPSSQQLAQNLIKIISLYFNANISTWNSQFLYQVVLDVYDESQFRVEKIAHFQSVVFTIVQKNQLHVHFFRGLFIMLLDYLCCRSTGRSSRVQSGAMFGEAQQLKWMNNEKKEVKFNAIKTLRRWVNNKHIDLNQTVSYNCHLLFMAYLTNFSLTDSHFNTELSKQFLKLVRQHLSTKSKQILLLTIIESIKNQQTVPRIRTLCVNLMRQLLEDSEIFSQMQENFDFIFTIDEHYSTENKLEIIQLMGFVVKSLPEGYFVENVEDPNSSQLVTFLHRICAFLYSCFDVVVNTYQDPLFSYRFCCSLVSLLRLLELKGNLSIIYAFYQQLIKEISVRNIIEKNYFLLYLTYEVADILSKNVNIPKEFATVNQNISSLQLASFVGSKKPLNLPKREQINEKMEKILIEDKYNDLSLIEETYKYNQIHQLLKNKVNQKNLFSTSKILRSYFANYCSNIHNNISTKEDNDDFLNRSGNIHNLNKSQITNSFGRKNSVFVESQNDSLYREDDKSLKDVIDIING